MSTGVKINNVTLVPIKEAAATVSYSRDYVARLAREGKIVATQIGRQWYVDVISLQNFSTTAETLEAVRKLELRAERKRELMAKECLAELDAVVVARMHKQRFEALLATVTVLCVGLFTGAGIFTISSLGGSPRELVSALSLLTPQYPERFAVESGREPSESVFLVMDEPKATLMHTTVVERPVFIAESEVRAFAAAESGILLFGQGQVQSEAQAVADLFSDPVHVEFLSNETGFVRYEQADGTMLEYPFVSVPEALSEVMPEAE
jgi:excisionase family DNA binding protein